jgi:hypothetical protein
MALRTFCGSIDSVNAIYTINAIFSSRPQDGVSGTLNEQKARKSKHGKI